MSAGGLWGIRRLTLSGGTMAVMRLPFADRAGLVYRLAQQLRPGPSSGFPLAVWVGIAAGFGVYLYVCAQAGWGYALGIAEPDNALLDFYERFGVAPWRLGHQPGSSWTGLLTGLWVHTGPWHLAVNALLLRLFGAPVERSAGWLALALAFVFTGVAGALCHAVFFPASGLALVGSSGGVAWVMGFCLTWVGGRIPVSVRWRGNDLSLPVFWLAALWLVLQLVGAVLAVSGGRWGEVAFIPHWSGFVLGMFLGWLWRRLGVVKEPVRDADRF